MRSAAAVLSEVWSHWPGRTDYQFQSQPLDASLKWIKTLHLPMVCDLGFLESVKRLHSVDAVTCGKEWKLSWLFPLRGLTVWTRSHFSGDPTPPLWCIHSLKGLDEEFTSGASGNLHTISPPQLWINQHWCKTIKSMRCGYLFILITLLHRAMHFGSFGVNALLKEDSEHRLPMPSLFHSMRAPSVSPEVVRQSTKAAIRRISNQTWAIRFFQHLLLSATSSGYHRGNESHWWRIWGNGMDR